MLVAKKRLCGVVIRTDLRMRKRYPLTTHADKYGQQLDRIIKNSAHSVSTRNSSDEVRQG